MNLTVSQVEQSQQSLPATLDKIESAIALANNPEEINKVLALMDAAVAYAKRYYKDQQDVIQRAKGLRLQAERRLGELLRDMPKATGSAGTGRPNLGGNKSEPPKNETTLSDLGIDKRTSSRAQRLAALPEKKFAAVASGEISVAKAIAVPLRKATAKSRANDAVQQHKAVVATEGSTYLIATMRSAYNAIEASAGDIEEQDKAIAMAVKLKTRLEQFITEQQGISSSLQMLASRAEEI